MGKGKYIRGLFHQKFLLTGGVKPKHPPEGMTLPYPLPTYAFYSYFTVAYNIHGYKGHPVIVATKIMCKIHISTKVPPDIQGLSGNVRDEYRGLTQNL